MVSAKDDKIREKSEKSTRCCLPKTTKINEIYQMLSDKDDQIKEIYQMLSAKDDQIKEINKMVCAKDDQIRDTMYLPNVVCQRRPNQ